MMVLNDKQAKVLNALRESSPQPMTPSQIGIAIEYPIEKASAQVTRPLRKLLKLGLIERVAVNQRVVHYELVSEEIPPYIISSHHLAEKDDTTLGTLAHPPINDPTRKIENLVKRIDEDK